MPDRAGVRVATWNLQWKGPRSPAASAIDQRLRRFEAQVAVLTEVRWPMLKLWRYQELAGGDRYPGTPEDGVKVAIASDLPMARKPLPVSDELLVRNTVVVDVDLGEGVTPLRVIGIVVRWNAIAAYLESGGFDRHLRRLQRAYHHQMEAMIDAVDQHLPDGTRFTTPQGGHVLWVQLPTGADSLALYEHAAADGVRFAPGPMFSASGGFREYLRLNTGFPHTPATNAQVATLGRLVAAAQP